MKENIFDKINYAIGLIIGWAIFRGIPFLFLCLIIGKSLNWLLSDIYSWVMIEHLSEIIGTLCIIVCFMFLNFLLKKLKFYYENNIGIESDDFKRLSRYRPNKNKYKKWLYLFVKSLIILACLIMITSIYRISFEAGSLEAIFTWLLPIVKPIGIFIGWIVGFILFCIIIVALMPQSDIAQMFFGVGVAICLGIGFYYQLSSGDDDYYYFYDAPSSGTNSYTTSPGVHYVEGYYRKDGTYVRPHIRSNPDGNPYNNLNR